MSPETHFVGYIHNKYGELVHSTRIVSWGDPDAEKKLVEWWLLSLETHPVEFGYEITFQEETIRPMPLSEMASIYLRLTENENDGN